MSTSSSRHRPHPVIRRDRARASVLAAVVLAACTSGPGRLRFHNQAPVWRRDDAVAAPRPERRRVAKTVYYFDYDFTRPISHALSVPERTLARNLNALGEVPDSGWFTNRIGVRDVSVAEIRRGGPRETPPTPPRRVREVFAGGGLLAKDANGVAFVLKLDTPEMPELASAADVISQRMMWAVGYNVPQDTIVDVTRTELVVEPDATTQYNGADIPFGEDELDAMLAPQERDASGRYRILASEFLPGVPVGPFTTEGTRQDDPNDRIPHEHRRELRGWYVFFGWLAHTDLHPGNLVDMWIEDPPGSGLGRLTHNVIDFDQSLGAFAIASDSEWDTYVHRVDYRYLVPSVLAFGMWKRPWEGLRTPGLRGVGRFDVENFRPDGYHPRDYFAPFLHKTDLDCFWAAKILMRIEPRHIRAAVESARLSDPRSTEYLVETLIARQRKSGRHWLGKLTPLDRFEVEHDGEAATLCATDLLVHHRLTDASTPTSYTVAVFDGDARPVRRRRAIAPSADGRVCVDELEASTSADGYVIVELRARGRSGARPPVFVHLAAHPRTGALRVIGVDRRA
jgi:hypothetical protein